MRKIMNISVSEEMHSFIIDRTHAGCHSSVSEYIRSLVRRDGLEQQERSPRRKKLPAPRRASDYFAKVAIPNDEP